MGLVVAPIVPGKLEAWKKWVSELNGPRKADLIDLNKRYGLTRHAAWLAETPGGPVVVALHEGPGGNEFIQRLGSSTNPVDVWFRGHIKDSHGMDASQPPPGPMPSLVLDSGQS